MSLSSNIASFGAGLLAGALIIAGFTEPPQVIVTEETEDLNFAAISFFDCNELLRVVFLTSYGRAETVKVDGAARLLDVQLRLSDIPYERAYYVVNERPCGFVVDEKETL